MMEKALLIHAGALGDFVMALRIVAALREAGAAGVTVLGKPEIAAVAVPGGGVDAVLDLNRDGYHRLFSGESSLSPPVLDTLGCFDLAVDMLGGPGSVCAGRLGQAGIPRVIGLDPRPRPDWKGHISDQWLADLRAAGIGTTPGPPVIRISEDRRDAARRDLREVAGSSGRLLAVLHPGSGSRQKCWPPARFIELGESLRARGWGLVFLLGGVEAERFTPTEMAAFRAVAATIMDRPLLDAAALLAGADYFIGNDSGMSHLAAASGTPTVAIFGPTDPGLWRPMGARATHVGPGPCCAWPSVADVVLAVRGHA
jgi:ADP-heptose:LPS heptosyltransferase